MYQLQSPRAIFSVNVIKRSLISLCLLLTASTAYSFGFQGSQPSFHTGWVLARSVVRDNAGKVQWSTYDEQGKQSPLSADCDETCVVMGAAEFNAWQQGFRDFKALLLNKDLVQGAEWMTAEAFRQGKAGFKTVDGKQAMNVPPLQAGTHSVYVRSKKQWYTPDSRIVLFESPLDKAEMESAQALGATGSALLDKDGKVVARNDAKTIGLAVKWFDGEQAYGETPVPAGSRPSNTPLPGSTSIYGGIPGIIVEGPSAFGAFKTVTRDSTVNQTAEGSVPGKGEKGAYTLRYMVPCAPNDFVDYQSTLVARLPYSRFSPTAVYPSYTYATRLVSDYCNSVGLGLADPTTLVGLMVAVNAAAINATTASPQVRTPIYVDVLYITGRIQMKNADGSAVQFGGETRYDAINPTAAEDTVIGPFDFDGDGKADRSERGNVDAQQNFTPAAEGDKVGIYLSSDPAGVPVKNAQGQIIGHRPHFVRLIDKKMDPKNKGYTSLKTISIADLKATDIYLYRKSNGHLVKHQAGLTDTDIRGRDASLPTSGDVQWGYVMNYLGPQAWHPPARSWADLQNETVKQTDDRGGSSSVMYTDSALKAKREADHLRIGEELTVVVINRKTGYMGTHTAKVEAPGASGRSGLTVSDEPLILQPPNLKIMAVREYEVEAGATNGQMRSYNIGMEGSALKKDKYVEIDSLWLDENDQMLPEDLGTRGYTGRLAKVAGDKLNDTQVSQFKIQPGLHKNMIKLGAGGQGDLGNEHYYLHVSGGVKDDAEAFRKPDFSTLGGDESGIWSSRPKWAVPFKVTTSREVQDLQEQMAYHDARNNSEPNSEAPKSPQANYGWEYRPEFQFSVFDLQVKEITQCKGENGQPATDCISDSKNTFTIYNKAKNIDTAFMDPGLDLLKILFDLQRPHNPRLDGFSEPELILAMGATEHKITGSSALSELYKNLASLALLDASNFLSIRLYQNNDAANSLFEYSFCPSKLKDPDKLHVNFRLNVFPTICSELGSAGEEFYKGIPSWSYRKIGEECSKPINPRIQQEGEDVYSAEELCRDMSGRIILDPQNNINKATCVKQIENSWDFYTYCENDNYKIQLKKAEYNSDVHFHLPPGWLDLSEIAIAAETSCATLNEMAVSSDLQLKKLLRDYPSDGGEQTTNWGDHVADPTDEECDSHVTYNCHWSRMGRSMWYPLEAVIEHEKYHVNMISDHSTRWISDLNSVLKLYSIPIKSGTSFERARVDILKNEKIINSLNAMDQEEKILKERCSMFHETSGPVCGRILGNAASFSDIEERVFKSRFLLLEQRRLALGCQSFVGYLEPED